MKKTIANIIRCERCNEILNPKNVKWLEMSNTDGMYYDKIPNSHDSQGAFPFGTRCAIKQVRETIESLKN